ncbi:hypothetical protein F8M41_004153 [Gigaspora margarita]|uniref:Uncharacterized protein n=1 Tax=Gigaspora margarita TaxID=4874 RepID=A0A8H4A7W0_GIGMA|nr:hypothetical protein F8M41_004153 [Gigaspora margarita]
MSDETASLDVINDSPSGVEGSFTFDVIHEFRRVKIGQIKLMFDVPYDTNRYSRTTSYKIHHNCSNNHILISSENRWGGFGYGDNTAKFFISTSDDPKKIEVVKNYVLNKHQQNRDEF